MERETLYVEFTDLNRILQFADKWLDRIFPPLPNRPVGFKVTISNYKGATMALRHAATTVDLQILENGTVKYTASPVDVNGNPTTLPAGTTPCTWASSDPALTLAADPADTSGFNLSQIGTAGKTAATAVVATVSTTLPGGSTPITGQADPVDIVPAPPGAAVGFVVKESAS